MVGARFVGAGAVLVPVTVIENAGSRALVLPSVTVMMIFE